MKLAVFLPGWVGDVVMATPALRALREHHPGAHLVGIGKPYVAGVVAGAPWFDELLLGTGTFSLARQLRQRRIDLAVLFPNSFRTALIAWLSGCRRRVGYGRYLRSWLLTDVLPAKLAPSPVLDAYNALARHVGCPDPGTRMELFTLPEDEALAERLWQGARFTGASEVIGFNPGAAFGAAKCWPTQHWIELARTLVHERGCRILVLGGPAERALGQEIAARVGLPEVVALADLVATPSLGLSKALVRRLTLLVTTDSGPRHFAACFGRPVVTLFGPTHIAWTETYHACAIHLQKDVPCGPCQQRVCPLRHHRCMKELAPEEVAAACAKLLPPLRRAG
jgi:heptosyltransferase-2